METSSIKNPADDLKPHIGTVPKGHLSTVKYETKDLSEMLKLIRHYKVLTEEKLDEIPGTRKKSSTT